MQPFIPEFIPAVGDIDAFLKVVPPKLNGSNNSAAKSSPVPIEQHINNLGLTLLDEPSGHQSEPALLHMKLRSIRTPGGGGGGTNGGLMSAAAAPPPSVSRSARDIDKWISEIKKIYVNQPFPMVVQRRKQAQDIDALMKEWPPEMERTLNSLGPPSAHLNCPLTFYIELLCSLLDIVIPVTRSQSDYIFALSTLFNLHMAVKNPIQ